MLALYERRYDDAELLFADSLESALRSGWRINVVYTLRGLAGVLAIAATSQTAARLLGASNALQERIGEVLENSPSTRTRRPRRRCSSASTIPTSPRLSPRAAG